MSTKGLILTFLISGIAWTSLHAESSAPPYLLVPSLSQSLQSESLSVKTEQLVETGDHLLVVGTSPSFTLEFADVRDNSGTGFDDPVQGSQRRAIAVSVFERVSQILSGEPGSARIVLDSRSPWLNQDTLALGIPFFQCIEGFQKPIIHGALNSDTHVHTHEGELLVNFELPQSASLSVPPAGQYDLFTSMFHEVTHILGFVGFTVEADGLPKDCGGARMMPAVAGFARDELGNPLWTEQGGEIEFIGHQSSLPSESEPMLLNLPLALARDLRLDTSNLQVTGHWLSQDFEGRNGVLMLNERLPTGVTRRNMTPETKSILKNVLEYQVAQDLRGLTGSWVDAQLNGQGLTLHFIDESRFVIYFFGFTDAGNRQWMIGLNNQSFELGETITVRMNEASGGQFTHFDLADIDESPWGYLDIRFLDCMMAEATLSGLDGVQDMSLFPLARVGGLDCY